MRPPATGLDDAIVERVVVEVVARVGYLDIPLTLALLDAVRSSLGGVRSVRRRGHLRLVDVPFSGIEGAAIVCPSGAA